MRRSVHLACSSAVRVASSSFPSEISIASGVQAQLLAMPIAVIRIAPDPSSFLPLAAYQAETPDSLNEPEVLHYSSAAEITFTPAAASPFQSPVITVYVTSKCFPS